MSIVLFVVESHVRSVLGEGERVAVVARSRGQLWIGVNGVGGSLRSRSTGCCFWREADVLRSYGQDREGNASRDRPGVGMGLWDHAEGASLPVRGPFFVSPTTRFLRRMWMSRSEPSSCCHSYNRLLHSEAVKVAEEIVRNTQMQTPSPAKLTRANSVVVLPYCDGVEAK